MYEVTFTETFKDGLERLPREIHPIIDRQLDQLAVDPFAKNPNATRLKNAPCSFRARIGIHVRMLYLVQTKDRRVIVQAIGTREHIYEQKQRSLAPLTSEEVKAIRAEIGGVQLSPAPTSTPNNPGTTAAPTPPIGPISAPYPGIPDLPVVIEELSWITEDHLFLLHVPDVVWKVIMASGSVDAMEKLPIDRWIMSTIVDYWTHPSPNQVEKLYGLSQDQGAESIAQQSLSHFLIALDPEQKEALNKIKMDGPYLLKGSAGTGKSLVGLYHIRDLADSGEAGLAFRLMPGWRSGACRAGGLRRVNALW